MSGTIESAGRKRGGGRRWFMVITLAALVLGGTTMLAASHFRGAAGWHRGPIDPETAKERIEFVSGFLLSKVEATDEQEAEIRAILEAAVDELAFTAEEHRAGREAFHDVFLQEDIDREALEQIRTAQMVLAEQASVRVVETLADVAEVLSLEQRQQLAELAARHHGH